MIENTEPQVYQLGILALIIASIVVIFPLLTAGYTTSDDAYCGVLCQNFDYSTIFTFATQQGRYPLLLEYLVYGQYNSLGIPYLIDNVWYYKWITLGSIALNIGLFSSILYHFIAQRLFIVLFALLFILTIQNHWEASILTAYPFYMCWGVTKLLLSLVFLLKYLKSHKTTYLVISVILAWFALALLPALEFFIFYFALFFYSIYFQIKNSTFTIKINLLRAFAIFTPYLLVIFVHIIIYFGFRYYYRDLLLYTGTQVNIDSPTSVLNVLYQYSISNLPTYIYFHYSQVFNSYSELIQGHSDTMIGFIKNLKSDWLIKSLFSAYFIYLLVRHHLINLTKTALLGGFIISIYLILVPNLLLSISPKYQLQVVNGSLTYIYGYHVFFGTTLFIVIAILSLSKMIKKNAVRIGYSLVLAGSIGIVSLLTDYANYYIAKNQTQSQLKWKTVDIFMDAVNIPENSFIYAPSLWQYTQVAAGYPHYWTDYFKFRKSENKNIKISNSLEEFYARFGQMGTNRLFYLKYAQETKANNQFILFAPIKNVRFEENRVVPLTNTAILVTTANYRQFTVFGNVLSKQFNDEPVTQNNYLFSQMVDKANLQGKNYVQIGLSSTELLDLESVSLSPYIDHKPTAKSMVID